MILKKVLYIVLSTAGIAGAALSCAMLISALQFSEWGRVIAYAFTLAVSVEIALVFIFKLKATKNQ